MNPTNRREARLRKRIALRLSQGWSLDKIADRVVWNVFGHLYSIRNGKLIVQMHNGDEVFGPAVLAGSAPLGDQTPC